MPTANKAAKTVFDGGKTSSYHVNSVVQCQSGTKSSALRIVVHRDGGNKRYEFEAESAKLASAFITYPIHPRTTFTTDLGTHDRRDCTDYQGSQDCVGAHG